MKLSGSDMKLFRRALMEAFPPATRKLRIVVNDADIGIDFAGYSGDFEDCVQTLLEQVAGKCQLTRLFKAAVDEAPDNFELVEIKTYVDTYSAIVPSMLSRDGGKDVEKQLEQVLFSNVGFQNVGKWLKDLDRLRRSVCRIEPQARDEGLGGYGTGFLVGKDIILTNDHVASGEGTLPGFWNDSSRARKVKVRFDCEYSDEGTPTVGKTYDLAEDFQVLRSPMNELDFALLRLKGVPADDSIEGKPRGFMLPSACDFQEDYPLLIIQHPLGEPMKLAFGAVAPRDKWGANRVNYTVNTAPGSSGSPCLTQDLKTCALHRQGADSFNSGVRMSEIISYWRQDGNSQKLRAANLGHLLDLGTALESIGVTPSANVAAPTSGGRAAEPVRLKKAFVIQSIGTEGSEIRKRSDRMLSELIGPACRSAGFEAERADKYPKETITEPIISALFGHPLVVADLGSFSNLTPNALIEVGFRLSTGRPIIFLADKPLPATLPLHLSDRRIIPVDPQNLAASQDELKGQLCDSLSRNEERSWTSEHACVDWRLALTREDPSLYLNANSKAAEFYGVKDADEIIGHSVEEVDARLYTFMDEEHKTAFLAEQEAIIGAIILSLGSRDPLTTAATVPIIFTRHPQKMMNRTIHLPVIANYKYDEQSRSIVFRTVYLQIDKWCASDLDNRRLSDKKIPQLFRESRNYDYDIFPCFDEDEFRPAQQLRGVLSNLGFKVWWPNNASTPAKYRNLSPSKLLNGLSRSRIAAVLIGKRNRGCWGAGELDEALFKHCAARKPLMLIMLPTADTLEPDTCLGDRYASVIPEPLYVSWPDSDDSVMRLAAGNGASFLERIVTELAKLLRL